MEASRDKVNEPGSRLVSRGCVALRLQPAMAWGRGRPESTLPLIDEPGHGWDTDARGDSVQGPQARYQECNRDAPI